MTNGMTWDICFRHFIANIKKNQASVACLTSKVTDGVIRTR